MRERIENILAALSRLVWSALALGAGERLWTLLGGALLLTASADFLLWPDRGGTSFALLVTVLALAFAFAAKRRSATLWIAVALAIAGAFQGAIFFHPGFAWVPFIPLGLIVAEGHGTPRQPVWTRLVDAGVALVFSWLSWRYVLLAGRSFVQPAESTERRLRALARATWVVLPAVVLTVIFGAVFAGGNAVFRDMVSRVFSSIFEWLRQWDFSFGRVVFWLVVFPLLLGLLRPLMPGLGDLLGRLHVPRWRRRDESLALWQSATVLFVASLFFFFINTLDVIYLWGTRAVPQGVKISEFLHEGVGSLIVAVLVSAAVMALVFVQELRRGRRLVQSLATLWVAQNAMLIASVFLRLKLYVDAYQMTLLRVGVALFLVVVIAGFVLLTIYFWRGKSLCWLVMGNGAAVFALFWLLQFADVSGFTARYNAGRALRDPKRLADLDYLTALGPAAWPSLERLGDDPRHRRALIGDKPLAVWLHDAARDEAGRLQRLNWRARQATRDRLGRELVEYAARQAASR